MNDKAISVLSEYDFEVIRSWKGRGTILFETESGIHVLKEYQGYPEKLSLQNKLLLAIQEQADLTAEQIVPNKDGNLYVQDSYQQTYIVKTYPNGRECNIREQEEYLSAIRTLARLHKVLRTENMPEVQIQEKPFSLCQEYEKHNKELKRVRKFLRNKNQKNEFERYLQIYYDEYMEKALYITEQWNAYFEKNSNQMPINTWYHGDYQHHNILFSNQETAVINFEKCGYGSQIRDLYLFLRKLLEKNNWSVSIGKLLLEEYQKERALNNQEMTELFYRLAYPEKFWKIINFYYNSAKSWIPGKNIEKFEKLIRQESEKETYLQAVF